MDIITIDPKKCSRWDFANRSSFEFGDLTALARDIKANGQVEPAIVRSSKSHGKEFEVIAGARRWKACMEFDIPLRAIIKELSDLEAFHHQVKENEKVPISDFSMGIHISKILDSQNITIQEVSKTTGYSKTKINNLLTFTKVDDEIWEQVVDMSKVSSRSAEMIFRLSNKGHEYMDALKQISEEIRKGAGAKKIESLVLTIVLGEDPELEYKKKIVDPNGNAIGFWTKSGINFEKGLSINQEKLEHAIIEAFNS